MIRRGLGRGKLILFGEHCCVYGYPAAVAALDLSLELEWRSEGEAAPGPGMVSPGKEEWVNLAETKEKSVFFNLLNNAREWTNKGKGMVPSGGCWYCRSCVPRVGGFGSSAALCAALARLVLGWEGLEYDRETHVLANYLEGVFHGSPSGIDTGASLSEGVSVWTSPKGHGGTPKGHGGTMVKNIPVHRFIEVPRLCMVYGALPRHGTTAKSVRRLRLLWDNGDVLVRNAMWKLGGVVNNFIRNCLAAGVMSGSFSSCAGRLMNRSQALLASLGLSNETMDFVFDSALSLGASGVKLSGGGMGRAFILCCPNSDSRLELIAALSNTLESRGIALAHPLSIIDFV